MIRTISRGYRIMATAASALAISLMLAPAAHASSIPANTITYRRCRRRRCLLASSPIASSIAVSISVSTAA